MLRFFKVYIMPAAVLQSVIVGGGYGTGREVVEFITSAGPKGGFAAIGFVFLIWGVVISLSFELARMMSSYNYRHFLKGLIGRAWLIYEALAIITLMIVLAVVLSASSQLIFDAAGIPKLFSVIAVICAVAWVMRYGARLVEKLLSVWAALVSGFLLLVFLMVLLRNGAEILTPFSSNFSGESWISKGGTFALYNVALIPVLLYSLTEIKTRTEAMISGVIAAGAAVLPATMMHLMFMSQFPNILDEPLPMYAVISGFNAPFLMGTYIIVLLGTILLTAVGALEGIAERVDGWMRDRRGQAFGARGRLMLGGATLALSAILSNFGVIELVAKGYGAVAWGFFAIYVVPVVTIGFWRVLKHQRSPSTD